MSDLSNQRVLVIGGSSGIGQAIATRALAAGAEVTIASRSRRRLDDALSAIGDGVLAAEIDTGDEAAVETFFVDQDAWDHVLVSAAETAMGSVQDLSLVDARAAMDSKFWGAYHVARTAKILPTGSLTFVSGFLSERPSPTSVLQGAINAALEALARGLALERAPVRVNCISPGVIDTPLWHRLPEDRRRKAFGAAAHNLPVARVGRPEDIANAAFYLMTTGFATGTTVRVDGGGAIA